MQGNCHIEETDATEGIRQFKIVENPQLTPEEEAERIAKLSLTAADVERALYKAFGKDFDDIIVMVQSMQPEGLDIKALKIELKANNFYRGNPYVEAIGNLLGITSSQLDEFFETNDYAKLRTGESSVSECETADNEVKAVTATNAKQFQEAKLLPVEELKEEEKPTDNQAQEEETENV